MDENREEELFKLLRYIAAGIDRIGAALTIQASESVKDEVIGSSEISCRGVRVIYTGRGGASRETPPGGPARPAGTLLTRRHEDREDHEGIFCSHAETSFGWAHDVDILGLSKGRGAGAAKGSYHPRRTRLISPGSSAADKNVLLCASPPPCPRVRTLLCASASPREKKRLLFVPHLLGVSV